MNTETKANKKLKYKPLITEESDPEDATSSSNNNSLLSFSGANLNKSSVGGCSSSSLLSKGTQPNNKGPSFDESQLVFAEGEE